MMTLYIWAQFDCTLADKAMQAKLIASFPFQDFHVGGSHYSLFIMPKTKE